MSLLTIAVEQERLWCFVSEAIIKCGFGSNKGKITHVKLVNELLDPSAVAGEVFRRCSHLCVYEIL